MAVLKSPRLEGADLSVGITGKTPLGFVSYGVAVSSSEESFTVENMRRTVLIDSTNPDSVTILTQPDKGVVYARADGNIDYDLMAPEGDEVNVYATLTGTQTFTYRRVNDGVSSDITATVTVTQSLRPAGWGKGDYFYMETDDNDRFVVQPGEDTRIIHISPTGLTDADLDARHGSFNAADFMSELARDENGDLIVPNQLYGETPETAMDELTVRDYLRYQYDDHPFRSFWMLYERGGSYNYTLKLDAQGGNLISESLLHPSLAGSYGTGGDPYWPGTVCDNLAAVYGMVIQDVHSDGTNGINHIDHLAIDGFRSTGFNPVSSAVQYPIQGGGIDFHTNGYTLRRAIILDPVQQEPTGGRTTWAKSTADRMSGVYQGLNNASKFEKIFTDMVAWQEGYRADRSKDFPKSPEVYSHGFYLQGDLYDVTMDLIIVTRPCFNGVQVRSGGVVQRVAIVAANAGLLLGNGKWIGEPDVFGDSDTLPNPMIIGSREYSPQNYTHACDILVTEASEKDVWSDSVGAEGDTSTLAGGITVSNYRTHLLRALVINGGEQKDPLVSSLDIGPVGRVSRGTETYGIRLESVSSKFDPCWYPATELGGGEPGGVIYKWSPSYISDLNTDGLDTTALDALSTGGFNDQWKGVSGSTDADFFASLRAEATPWDQIPALLEYYQTPTGQFIPRRSAATTVKFDPHASGGTPGFRSDVLDDWSTNDFPGSFAGDNVDLNGYKVFWHISPEHEINDLTFGGGSLWMRGGDLQPTGTVTGDTPGSEIKIRGGARFSVSDLSGELDVHITDGRFRNRGTIADGVSIKAAINAEALLAEPGGAFTLGDGHTLTIGGWSKAGGDGQGGGTGTITLAAGSKTRFQASGRLRVDQPGIPPFYTTVTGVTSGATGIMHDHVRRDTGANVNDLWYLLYDLTGVFEAGESLTAPVNRTDGFRMVGGTDWDSTNAGRVASSIAMQSGFGQLRKFRSGIWGVNPTDMVLNIAMGGTLEIDMAGHTGALTHTLIEADALSGDFDTVSVLNLGDRDATVTIGATAVTIEVTTGGTGQVTLA